jgi:ATP-binding cassette subfamily B protein
MSKKKNQPVIADDDENLASTDKGGGRGPRDFRKPKNAKQTLVRLLGYAMDYKWLLFASLVCMLVASLTNVVASYFLKPLIDDHILPNVGKAVKDWSGLTKTLCILGGIYLAGIAANYLQHAMMATLSHRAINKIRKELFDKMQDLPISYFDQHSNGEIMSRYINDADTVQMALEMTITMFISSIITFVGVVFMMIVLNWKLFLITLVALCFDVFFVKKIGGKSRIKFRDQQKTLGEVNAYVEEMVSGIKVVKAFTYEDRARGEFGQKNEAYREAATHANFLGMVVMPLLGQFMGIFYAITTVVGAIMVIRGVSVTGGAAFTVGALGSYLVYTKQVTMPINQISQQMVQLLSALAGAERIFAVMDAEPEVDEGTVTVVPCEESITGYGWKTENGIVPHTGRVELKNVSFHYVEGKPVLRNITLTAEPGQKIAFVGSTGAGKTTITNLINRFYDVQEGSILYDGIDVKQIKKDDLRRSMVVILQDTHLFSGTIMENIRYGNLDATDDECVQAAKTANAYDFIMTLPDGFQTHITGDGGNLSQGQRQLLNIARAAVAKPPVLIMDEATSSIDTRTEKLIEQGMDGLMQNRTVFVIAHRLSTVRNSDKIAVIEAGQIIEFGNHQELIANRGRYYELYTGQHLLE